VPSRALCWSLARGRTQRHASLGMAIPESSGPKVFNARKPYPEVRRQLRSLRVLTAAFRAADLAEPAGDAVVADQPAVAPEASLFEVIRLLTKHERVRVSGGQGDVGVIARADLHKLVGRTWLFGMVAFIEIVLTTRVAARWSEAEWSALLPTGRLEKCRQVRDERRRRGQVCELIDCLQFSDKAQILIGDPLELSLLGFESKTAAKRATGELELLRNNLAHSQEIVTDHWFEIAGLARRIELAMEEASGLGL
jgi:hypothetical protein